MPLNWATQLTGMTVYTAATGGMAQWVPLGATTSSTTMSFNTTTTASGWPAWPMELGGDLYIAPYVGTGDPTPDQLAAAARRAQLRDERRATRARAQDRAVELLRALLDPVQLAQYELDGSFEVQGSAGGRYRIRPGSSGNVRLLGPAGAELAGLCAHPRLEVHGDDGAFAGHLPVADVAVGQMLLLQTDEHEFHRRANVHWREAGFDAAMRQLVAA